ncbi:MAG: hypothetical protein AAB738_03880 [Patescibacteria group bacterium]
MPKTIKDSARPSCQWFIEPMNPAANEALVQEFPGHDTEEVTDSSGASHKVFCCTWTVVDKLFRATPQASLPPQYKVYSRQGGSRTKRVSFFEPKSKKKTKKGAVEGEPPVESDSEGVF